MVLLVDMAYHITTVGKKKKTLIHAAILFFILAMTLFVVYILQEVETHCNGHCKRKKRNNLLEHILHAWTGAKHSKRFTVEHDRPFLFTWMFSCSCSSTVITLEMRSLTMNGLIFYAADSETDPKNFISLELVNGRLRYQFRSATGQVAIETTRRYALDGVWYKVTLLKSVCFYKLKTKLSN